ncbi:ATP phosphoribosyltransferase regulatory subunit [Telmatospirillum sp. J64-1]|uniref:ATP phosphoribosyltransferase regulatory subunit n=1 Tax=Telmatospirillum sp. J64-1 TaxID=2502183 RepID=UPI00115F15E9|nr:ATP phosphoribosyltransferase regulatory subunit [Telmatospirillum sp. J64-1]
MNDYANRALLPAGLRDILPPDAAFEAEIVQRLMGYFAAQGYERVKPPLIEFEESLLTGVGAGMAGQTFRIMDPVSQRMMGVRADMTLQVARIATTRLGNAPRPLRLSYAGQVLRVKGSQLRPERQFGQAGLELIGSDSPAADAEVVVLAAEALAELGLSDVSVDLTLPTLVPALCADLDLDEATIGRLRGALDHKDAALVAAILPAAAAKSFCDLLQAAGPADQALAALRSMSLPRAAAHERDRLAVVVELVRSHAPGLALTVDPVENRGYEYHSGVSFTIFSRRAIAELGRGGRYLADGDEPATGVTLFMDTVQAVLPAPAAERRVFLPFGTAREVSARLRGEGWVTVAGLEEVADPRAEARRLNCGHLVMADRVIETE